jgi:hypothetical protein
MKCSKFQLCRWKDAVHVVKATDKMWNLGNHFSYDVSVKKEHTMDGKIQVSKFLCSVNAAPRQTQHSPVGYKIKGEGNLLTRHFQKATCLQEVSWSHLRELPLQPKTITAEVFKLGTEKTPAKRVLQELCFPGYKLQYIHHYLKHYLSQDAFHDFSNAEQFWLQTDTTHTLCNLIFKAHST